MAHLSTLLDCGTSPRVRGKPGAVIDPDRIQGYIPACAGETVIRDYDISSHAVHPRVCGGNLMLMKLSLASPGYIPACAGETHQNSWNDYSHRVHPRVLRGKPEVHLGRATNDGYIPACAGETGADRTESG